MWQVGYHPRLMLRHEHAAVNIYLGSQLHYNINLLGVGSEFNLSNNSALHLYEETLGHSG